MASFGDSLVVLLILLAFAIPTAIVASEFMFEAEASGNGYLVDGEHNPDGCYQTNDDADYRKYCKSDYGFLGWRSWWSVDDNEFMKETIHDLVNQNQIKDMCPEGITSLDYTMEFGDDEPTRVILTCK